jgi:tetratricopeptide (TPR) repeat protein
MDMEQIEMVDFFISYNKADKAWAEWIAWELEENGCTTVLQAWDFMPASNFVLEMQKAATIASRTIAVLSPDYLNASYPQPEWTAAFVQDPTGEKGTLVPVCVCPCELKGMWPSIIHIDLMGLNEAKAKNALLEGVKRGRIKPLTKPGFPGIVQRQITEQPRFPGALPSIWNVPHQRNPNFTGRVQLMSDLQKALASGPTALTQVIHGLGGVGKTQLALEHVYRNLDKYNIIWWLRSEDSATLASDYAILAQELDLPDKGAADQNLIIAAVRRYLEQQQNWLLVFDNADDPARIKEYIPRGGLGHVLVTSRNPNWRGTASPLSVEVLEREESVDFLVKRTGKTDTESASALADALGDLPLALDQAGAYIEAAGISLSSYLDMFNTHKTKLLCRSSPSTDYPYEVATTWNISIGAVRKTCQAGVDLLNLCAFLAPDDIYEELVTDGAKHLPDSLSAAVTDPLIFTDVVKSLRRYSLIEFSGSTISVHRMVQAVVRDQLTTEGRKRWAEAAVRLVDDAFPSGSGDVQNWSLCSRLLPHALAAAEYAEAVDVATNATLRLLNQTGVYLHERGRFVETKETLEQAHGIGNRVLGGEHPSTLTSMSNLAVTLKAHGDLAGARKIEEEVLEIRRRILGEEHPDTLTSMNNLASTLREQGELGRAREIEEEVLEVMRRVLGNEHPDTLTSMSNLAATLHKQGELERAREIEEEVLEVMRRVLGSEHPKTSVSAWNLFTTIIELGDSDSAITVLETDLLWLLERDHESLGANQRRIREMIVQMAGRGKNAE